MTAASRTLVVPFDTPLAVFQGKDSRQIREVLRNPARVAEVKTTEVFVSGIDRPKVLRAGAYDEVLQPPGQLVGKLVGYREGASVLFWIHDCFVVLVLFLHIYRKRFVYCIM